MISSLGAILVWKSDDDAAAAADADYDDDRKSDPYMSPSYAGDTKTSQKARLYHINLLINCKTNKTAPFANMLSEPIFYICMFQIVMKGRSTLQKSKMSKQIKWFVWLYYHMRVLKETQVWH